MTHLLLDRLHFPEVVLTMVLEGSHLFEEFFMLVHIIILYFDSILSSLLELLF